MSFNFHSNNPSAFKIERDQATSHRVSSTLPNISKRNLKIKAKAIEVHVSSLMGTERDIRIRPYDTVQSLKRKLGHVTGLAKCNLRVYQKHAELRSGNMADNDVADGSHLTFSVKLQSGLVDEDFAANSLFYDDIFAQEDSKILWNTSQHLHEQVTRQKVRSRNQHEYEETSRKLHDYRSTLPQVQEHAEDAEIENDITRNKMQQLQDKIKSKVGRQQQR